MVSDFFAVPSLHSFTANAAKSAPASIARTAHFELSSLDPFSQRLTSSLFRFAGHLRHFELEFTLAAFRAPFALVACPAPATVSSSAPAPQTSASSAHSFGQIAATPTSSSLPP